MVNIEAVYQTISYLMGVLEPSVVPDGWVCCYQGLSPMRGSVGQKSVVSDGWVYGCVGTKFCV